MKAFIVNETGDRPRVHWYWWLIGYFVSSPFVHAMIGWLVAPNPGPSAPPKPHSQYRH